MAERNAVKARTCRTCGAILHGKASVLKQHGRERGHRKVMLDAAQEALMEKIKAELARPVPGLQMADPRVMNAEGD